MKEVPLSKGLFALVDDDDFERAASLRWYALKRGKLFHAARTQKKNGTKKTIYMHRWLTDAPAGMEVDHKDGNGLNNTRENLRVCTHAENAINHKRSSPTKTSQYQGVAWDKKASRWVVVICAGPKDKRGNAKQIYLGRFKDEVEAARAYDRAAIERHGEFAVTNFSREDYQ